MASLIVGGNGSGVGRERNPCGGRISMSGGFGQFACSGSVVQADKATVDSASSIGLNGQIDGNLLDDGVALLANDADVVDLLDDDLDGGLRLPLSDGGDSSLKQSNGTDSSPANGEIPQIWRFKNLHLTQSAHLKQKHIHKR